MSLKRELTDCFQVFTKTTPPQGKEKARDLTQVKLEGLPGRQDSTDERRSLGQGRAGQDKPNTEVGSHQI